MEKIGKIDRVVFSIILFVFAAVTTVHALSFPGNARWLPLGTGSIVSALMAILIASEFSPRISRLLGVYHGLLEEMNVGDDEDEGE